MQAGVTKLMRISAPREIPVNIKSCLSILATFIKKID
jgi:hypothetical protein